MRSGLQRLQKARHVLLRRRRSHAPTAQRLAISKAPWLNDAASPVVLMIDDLTNAWHGRPNTATWEPGGDWGGGLDHPQGALAFLENNLLRDFPEVRATFFVVAGPISAYTRHQPFAHAAPLDATEASRRFFAGLTVDPRFELAYHGYNHGTAGATTELFLQEWRGFPSRQAAVEQTRQGLEIFRRTTGGIPRGGKYGGWEYNEFSEAALNELGFLWWCRDWMPRDVTGAIGTEYYEPQFFGAAPVLAIPSTVHGHFWDRRQIDILLRHRQIIGIEEHIAPLRPDNLVQTPNIVDDSGELRRLYQYLRGKDVWHANCTDIAEYVIARERSTISDISRESFVMHYNGRVEKPVLTLSIDGNAICSAAKPHIELTAPDGTRIGRDACRFDERNYHHLVTVPVMNGVYLVTATTRPS